MDKMGGIKERGGGCGFFQLQASLPHPGQGCSWASGVESDAISLGRTRKDPSATLFSVTHQFLGGWEPPSSGRLGQRGPLVMSHSHPIVIQDPTAAPSRVILCVSVCVEGGCLSEGQKGWLLAS